MPLNLNTSSWMTLSKTSSAALLTCSNDDSVGPMSGFSSATQTVPGLGRIPDWKYARIDLAMQREGAAAVECCCNYISILSNFGFSLKDIFKECILPLILVLGLRSLGKRRKSCVHWS